MPKIGEYLYVLLWMGLYWVTEVVPIPITALLPMMLYPLLTIMSAREFAPLYLNNTMMLFIGGLMFALAIEKTNLHLRIALSVLKLVGSTVRSHQTKILKNMIFLVSANFNTLAPMGSLMSHDFFKNFKLQKSF